MLKTQFLYSFPVCRNYDWYFSHNVLIGLGESGIMFDFTNIPSTTESFLGCVYDNGNFKPQKLERRTWIDSVKASLPKVYPCSKVIFAQDSVRIHCFFEQCKTVTKVPHQLSTLFKRNYANQWSLALSTQGNTDNPSLLFSNLSPKLLFVKECKGKGDIWDFHDLDCDNVQEYVK